MHINNLYLQNFKVFSHEHIQFQKPRSIIVGQNGFGKTTLLEAIHTFLTSYSFSKQSDHELLSYQMGEYALLGDLQSQEQNHSLVLRYDAVRKKKHFVLDGRNISRYRSLLEKFPVVSFTPLDIQNILGEPSFRRLFFDRMISYLNPEYYSGLKQYRKILKERNRLLKLKDDFLLDMWNEKFLSVAAFLLEEREKYLSLFNQFHMESESNYGIPEFLRPIRWVYKGPKNMEDLKNLLQKKHTHERLAQTTLFGPHRDDYLILGTGDREIKKYFSLGQIKWTTFYMKFLEVLLMNKLLLSPPIFLLDDVLSELDINNRQLVFPLIEKLENQVIMTTTDHLQIEGCFFELYDIFHIIKPGEISVGSLQKKH